MERGRRQVSGDGQIGKAERSRLVDPDRAHDGIRRQSPLVLDLDRHATGAQHALGVVAGRRRLAHRRRSVGEQAGEQEARLHLCRSDGHPVIDALKRAARQVERRQPTLGPLDDRAHLRQRPENPAHRPAPDRVVAVELEAAPVLTGEQACEQADQRPGVADVDRARGLLRAAQAEALDLHVHPAVVRGSDRHLSAERPDRAERAPRVVGVEEAGDRGVAIAEAGEQRGAMGDRLVRRGDAAHPRRGPAGSKRRAHVRPPARS